MKNEQVSHLNRGLMSSCPKIQSTRVVGKLPCEQVSVIQAVV
jgi:hypothetical protein